MCCNELRELADHPQQRSRRLHPLPAAGRLSRAGRAREAACLPRLGILGQARARLRRSATRVYSSWDSLPVRTARTGRAALHRRRFRQFHVPRIARNWIRQPAYGHRSQRWYEVEAISTSRRPFAALRPTTSRFRRNSQSVRTFWIARLAGLENVKVVVALGKSDSTPI